MGTFSNLVKRYVKTVDPPVSDHSGMFVKETTDTSIFGGEYTFFTFYKRSYNKCSVVPCCHSNFFVCTDRRTKKSTIVGLQEV